MSPPLLALSLALVFGPAMARAAETAAPDALNLRMAPALGPRMVKPQGGGQGWACPEGQVRSGTECKALQVPANATMHTSGRIWTCNRGFRKVGLACQEVAVPANASLDEMGTGYVCDYGYARSGLACVKRK